LDNIENPASQAQGKQGSATDTEQFDCERFVDAVLEDHLAGYFNVRLGKKSHSAT
jgi:hypothetical protein